MNVILFPLCTILIVYILIVERESVCMCTCVNENKTQEADREKICSVTTGETDKRSSDLCKCLLTRNEL